ncbi:MAG TPA: L-threonylcarbamoyladenylate synthase [Trueperaceae bacterium]
MSTIFPPSDENLRRAVRLLRAGQLVSFPTETVYGLGGDASNPEAVTRIFEAKGRPADHPLIVHLAGAEQLGEWARIVPQQATILAQAFWPGPLTIVLERAPAVPLEVTGGQDTVALRVPAHPVAQRLLASFGGGLAAPSANPFGRLSPTTAQHVAEQLGGRVAAILDGGPTEVGVESTIVDLSSGTPRILRPGGVGRHEIAALLGSELGPVPTVGAPRVPGSLERHYSPGCPVELVAAARLEALAARGAFSVLARRSAPIDFEGNWRRLPDEAGGYARGLYAALHELDRAGLPILVEEPPEGPEWEAVRDRLRRASAGRRAVAGEGTK